MAKQVPMISVDASALNKVGKALQKFPDCAGDAVARTLWALRDFTRKEIIRQIPRVYDTTQTQLRGAISAARKRFVSLRGGENSVSIEVLGKRPNLARFHHTPSAPPKATGKRRRRRYQAKVAVFRGSGMKAIRAQRGADGKSKPVFLAPTGAKNGVGVPYIFFSRAGRPAVKNPEREAIEPRYSVAVPQMILNEKVRTSLVTALAERLNTETERQIHREMENALYGVYRGGK